MRLIIAILLYVVIGFSQFTKQDTLDYVNKAIIQQYGIEINEYFLLSEPANGIGYIFDWTHPTIPKPTKTQLLNAGKAIYQAEQAVEYLRLRELEYPKSRDMARALFEKEMGAPGKYNTLRDSVISVNARYTP